ncbi:hypothetical protein [Lagierella massiliensis]|uniref:hypothetical protein n=1 Tax=Lagierella massiliensis TaxID=1689303 RepID=UPI0006D802AF|nr:hypothetical protein [Lagierella massiliensis]
MIKNKKNFILCLSLILNLILGGSLVYKNMEVENVKRELALYTFLSKEEDDNKILKIALDKLSKEDSVKILDRDSEDVTSVYKETFLELKKEGNFKTIQDIILSENLSISAD